MKLIIINGPNLNLLGIREKKIYGSISFESYTGIDKSPFFIKLEISVHPIIIPSKLQFLINNSELLDSIKQHLLNQISKSEILDPTAQDHYLQKNFIVISELYHAPIIGAGVDAYYATQ